MKNYSVRIKGRETTMSEEEITTKIKESENYINTQIVEFNKNISKVIKNPAFNFIWINIVYLALSFIFPDMRLLIIKL